MNFEEIYTNGEYLNKNPTWDAEDAVWKAEMVKKIIKKNTSSIESIVEVGCGSGAILAHLQKTFTDVNFSGFDISPQGIAIAKRCANDKLSFYNQDYINERTITTDILLVIDVIEHVPDFLYFLNRLKREKQIFCVSYSVRC
ncbi:MAG: class I SAM-dependent methyltransferase [Chitinophagaceae bacterium]|nr:class I SAM-dependent methyltransferase [Chitinophagaceae bacterium]